MAGDGPPAAEAACCQGGGGDDGDGDDDAFDYVVVGSGPSCAGLVWGLMLRESDRQRQRQPSPSAASPDGGGLRIAVLERGPRKPAAAASCPPPPLSDWFRASHDPAHPHTDLNEGTVEYQSRRGPRRAAAVDLVGGGGEGVDRGGGIGAQEGEGEGGPLRPWRGWRRALDVPAGRGWGGTALINAGLCQLPLPEDFQSWPSPYKERMMESCRAVMRQLAGNGCLARGGGGAGAGDPLGEGDGPHYSSPRVLAVASGSGEPEVRRCTYWEGLLRVRSLPDPSFSSKSDPGMPQDTAPDQIRALLERHVRFFEGSAERLLFADRLSDRTDDGDDGHGQDDCGERVIGVEYSTAAAVDGAPVSYRSLLAARDVILCAGAIETPALLLASGVGGGGGGCEGADCGGRRGAARACGAAAASLSDLPVGDGLRDHVALSRAVMLPPWRGLGGSADPAFPPPSANGVVALRALTLPPHGTAGACRIQAAAIEGAAYDSILPAVVPGWFRWESARQQPRERRLGSAARLWLLEIGLGMARRSARALLLALVGSRWSPVYWFLRSHVVTLSVFLMNPLSTGSVRIRRRRTARARSGPSPRQREEVAATEGTKLTSHLVDGAPLRRRDVELEIRLGYLDAPEDVEAVRRGWIASQALEETLLGGVSGIEVFPGLLVRRLGWPRLRANGWSLASGLDLERFEAFARATCLPYFHWCGSCRMVASPDDDRGVVTPDLKVRGCRGLRICDASVFPSTVSAPTALTCAALGHLFGSRILVGDA